MGLYLGNDMIVPAFHTDTDSADAYSEDIRAGKTAFVKGKKVTGTANILEDGYVANQVVLKGRTTSDWGTMYVGNQYSYPSSYISVTEKYFDIKEKDLLYVIKDDGTLVASAWMYGTSSFYIFGGSDVAKNQNVIIIRPTL